MTTAQSCVRPRPALAERGALSDHLRVAALLPGAPRRARGGARFSPRVTDRMPASTVGATLFADAPQRWGISPHVGQQVVEVRAAPPSPSPAIAGERGFAISTERVAPTG